MDANLVSALIGALVSIICVVVGWFLAGYERRQQKSEEVQSLSCALVLEVHALAWHILNTKEALSRAIEQGEAPSADAIEYYLPPLPSIYDASGHEVAKLNPVVTGSLVEFHTHFNRSLARTRRICGIDGRKLRKSERLEGLKGCVSDRGYVAWAAAVCLEKLLPKASASLASDQHSSVVSYARILHEARGGKRWTLPDDGLGLVFDEVLGTDVPATIINELRKI
ncbi:MAG: hypothetical protein ABL907_21235 [Hyphomicrobium sp.]